MPRVLIIHLKRFKYTEEMTSVKLNHRVTYPEVLECNEIMQGYQERNYKVRSKSIIRHSRPPTIVGAPSGLAGLAQAGFNGSGDAAESPTKIQNVNFSVNQSTDCEEEKERNNYDSKFNLTSAVVHCGEGLLRGHYIAVCKTSEPKYLILDDQDAYGCVNIDEFYGTTVKNGRGNGRGKGGLRVWVFELMITKNFAKIGSRSNRRLQMYFIDSKIPFLPRPPPNQRQYPSRLF